MSSVRESARSGRSERTTSPRRRGTNRRSRSRDTESTCCVAFASANAARVAASFAAVATPAPPRSSVHSVASAPDFHARSMRFMSGASSPSSRNATCSNRAAMAVRCRSTSVSSDGQSAYPIATQSRARSTSSVGRSWVWRSCIAWMKFSSRRRNRYAASNSSAASADRPRAPTSRGNATCNSRDCSDGSLPPRTSCKDWTMNSASRIPPGPSLMLSCNSRRFTSAAIIACISRNDSNTP